MKRVGHLYEGIAEMDNLRHAYLLARRGKQAKPDALAFGRNLQDNLLALRNGLLAETVAVGDYHYFTIHDPKERRICAPSFRERVLHHAVMAVCEPVLERFQIFDSYACRRGKGNQAALLRARDFAASHPWFLKMDVRKYFDSVDHEILYRQLARRFKDARLLAFFSRLLASHSTAPGKGLPIGSLTSQHLANFHLSFLDGFVKHELRRKAYLRYMDDFIVFGESRQDLRQVLTRIREFLQAELKLELKSSVIINATSRGLPFLGFRIFPATIRLSRLARNRFARRLRYLESGLAAGVENEAVAAVRIQAMIAYLEQAASLGFRQRLLSQARIGI
jgi:hypothetical protein